MTLTELGRRSLREPLAHFLIAGALVFWLLSGRPPDLGERRIVVDERVVGGLVQRFYASFRRPPSQDEIDGMIRDHVKDEVYYREALSLGLDQGDEVVVRRMRRKMETLAVADAEAATPSDAELQALLDKDPARYALDPRASFEQVYLGADTPAARIAADAALMKLRKGIAVDGLPAPLPVRLEQTGAGEIAATFGDEFALALPALRLGQWSGPVASGLGLHLVRVTVRSAREKPRLDSVRQRLENDWRAAAVARAQDTAYAKIARGYEVIIEKPKE